MGIFGKKMSDKNDAFTEQEARGVLREMCSYTNSDDFSELDTLLANIIPDTKMRELSMAVVVKR